jgi:hypothetical protein
MPTFRNTLGLGFVNVLRLGDNAGDVDDMCVGNDAATGGVQDLAFDPGTDNAAPPAARTGSVPQNRGEGVNIKNSVFANFTNAGHGSTAHAEPCGQITVSPAGSDLEAYYLCTDNRGTVDAGDHAGSPNPDRNFCDATALALLENPYDTFLPDFRPTAALLALVSGGSVSPATPPDDGFFDIDDPFIGAVRVGDMWFSGWTWPGIH